MPIREAVEHGPVSLEPGDLMHDGAIQMRQDVLRRGFVEWRSLIAKDLPKDATDEVLVERTLFAKGVIGLVPLSHDLSVMVKPRFPASITHMVNVCDWPTIALDVLRHYTERPGAADAWMLDRLAGDLILAVRALLDQGLMRTYDQRQAVTSSPKGRIQIGRTIREQVARGISYRANVTFFARTEATPANQAILAAVRWSFQWLDRRMREVTDKDTLQSLKAHQREALRHLHSLRFIEDDPKRKFLDDPYVRGMREVPESRSEYRRALQLSVALLERRGFSLEGAEGTLALSSLLLSTDKLFEEFVRQRLKEYIVGYDIRDGNRLSPERKLFKEVAPPKELGNVQLLNPGANKVQPDILVEHGTRTLLVADVKYQLPKDARHAERSALEQVTTYAARLGCKEAMTVHPCGHGQSPGLVLSGKIGDIRIWQYRVSLVDDLDAGMLAMTRTIETLCGLQQQTE